MAISFSRIEKILENMLGYPVTIEQPNSRIEELLIELGDVISEGGTKDYDDLTNKPSINNVTLSGNKTLSDLGIVNPLVLKGRVNSVSDLPASAEVGWFYLVGLAGDDNLREYVYTDSNRWEFVGFNNLVIDATMSSTSENPVQNKVITAALSGKVDTVSGYGLSQENYTSTEKQKLQGLSNYDITSDIEVLTQAEYDALATKDKAFYFIYDS